MKVNELLTSGQVVDIATGETYTLRTDEVMINAVIYRKADIEIFLKNNYAGATDTDVGIGIQKRDGIRNLPADGFIYTSWVIDTVAQVTGLEETVEAISAGIRE